MDIDTKKYEIGGEWLGIGTKRRHLMEETWVWIGKSWNKVNKDDRKIKTKNRYWHENRINQAQKKWDQQVLAQKSQEMCVGAKN